MVREKTQHARHYTEFELIDRFFTRGAHVASKRSRPLEQFSARFPNAQARRQYGDRGGQSRSPSRSDGGDPTAIPNTQSGEATPGKPLKIALGIGDDCALITCAEGMQLAISTDMLVEGRHFFADAEPRALGHKALAVNLSDLAAMGAAPRAFTLALALPEAREDWLAPFSEGLFALADQYECQLIGGDTTAGPRAICITVFGDVEPERALRRDAARAGDDVWVSGLLGDARLALGGLRDEWTVADCDWPHVRRALDWPQPRIALGRALAGLAHAAIDLSDGLAGDLMHLVTCSNVTAAIDIDRLPRSAALARMPPDIQRHCTLCGGDNYELCFTAPASARAAIVALGTHLDLPVTRIGTILAFDPSAARIRWQDARGTTLSLSMRGFDHFRSDADTDEHF